MSLTIHCKYKYFDSTVQRAEDRRQKFHFCRLPFAVNVMLNLSNDFTVVERGRSKFILESFESKLNSGSSDGKEMILTQNSDILVPKYIGRINFAFHFLEQIQRAD